MKNISRLSLIPALLFVLPLAAEEPQVPQPTIQPLINAQQKKALNINKNKDAPPAAPAPSKLSEENQAVVGRVEDYFNSIRTLKAEFMQTLSNGTNTNGTLFIKRPGKMRLEYAPPNRDLLVADGLFVHAWDSQAKTSSSVPLGRSLADIILRDPLKLSGDINVKEIRQFPNMIEIDIVQANDPSMGIITLELQDNPLQLKNWRVKDGQGAETRVSLYNEQVNQNISSGTFAYKNPNFGR